MVYRKFLIRLIKSKQRKTHWDRVCVCVCVFACSKNKIVLLWYWYWYWLCLIDVDIFQLSWAAKWAFERTNVNYFVNTVSVSHGIRSNTELGQYISATRSLHIAIWYTPFSMIPRIPANISQHDVLLRTQTKFERSIDCCRIFYDEKPLFNSVGNGTAIIEMVTCPVSMLGDWNPINMDVVPFCDEKKTASLHSVFSVVCC